MANVLNANPNRMELMKLGKRLSLAKRGHRLLKDKQDELMDRFTEVTESVKTSRKEAEQKYSELKSAYFMTRYLSDNNTFEYYSNNPFVKINLDSDYERVMNLLIPILKAEVTDNTQDAGNLNVSSNYSEFVRKFINLFKVLLMLANTEKKMYMVANELEKVRRRVNALEYIFIPKLEETIMYVAMQLEEMEREDIVRLMKIKDIVRNK